MLISLTHTYWIWTFRRPTRADTFSVRRPIFYKFNWVCLKEEFSLNVFLFWIWHNRWKKNWSSKKWDERTNKNINEKFARFWQFWAVNETLLCSDSIYIFQVACYCNNVWQWHIKRPHLSAQSTRFVICLCLCVCEYLSARLFSFQQIFKWNLSTIKYAIDLAKWDNIDKYIYI